MSKIQKAVILMGRTENMDPALLQRDIAGISLFKRLILTLQRGGMEEIAVLSTGLTPQEKSRRSNDITSDPRFCGVLYWINREETPNHDANEEIQAFSGPGPFLLVESNLVTSPQTVKEFIHRALEEGTVRQNRLAVLKPNGSFSRGMTLVPSGNTRAVEQVLNQGSIAEPVEFISLENDRHFTILVRDDSSARFAEKYLIRQHKSHYTQVMDIWVNSRFSLPLSSVLVKTPFSPNQLTLLGLLIGLGAGIFFARGDYLGQVLGGLFLMVTAIWDCCDGDVARLKFMESDFGEFLDTVCDNIINIFAFTGMMIGVGKMDGFWQGFFPFLLLATGGLIIASLIYFPRGGKGEFFSGTWMHEVIQLLASRNFIYIILVFSVAGRVDWFLWLAGFGSILFALFLFLMKRKILGKGGSKTPREIQDFGP